MAFANASSLVLATSCAGSPAGGGAAPCGKADEENTDNATAAMRIAVRCILDFTS
jgi:hypothetical protein